MKKLFIIALTALVAAFFAACSADVEDTTESDTSETTAETSVIVTSTTGLNLDDAKSAELKDSVLSYFEHGDIAVEPNGSFVFEYHREAKLVYAFERDADTEKQAEDNAEAFVEEIRGFYPDDITLADFSFTQIGDGDNGIDSVRYEAYYTNSQNQLLTIYLDSDAVISYIECTLTW